VRRPSETGTYETEDTDGSTSTEDEDIGMRMWRLSSEDFDDVQSTDSFAADGNSPL